MEIIKLDCKGLPCPEPVLRTKEAIDNGTKIIIVTVDNEASKNNVTRFGSNQKCDVSSVPLGNDTYEIKLICPNSSPEPKFNADDYSCPPLENGKDLVYVISSDSMGRGNNELGWALLQTFIQTIKDIQPLPQKILFYNSGVKLVTEHTGALKSIEALQKKGTEILVCGTCLDFFKLKAKIKVGKISNMYEIMISMTEASKVISPH